MDAKDLFTLALQLTPEWRVPGCQLDQMGRRLTLKLDLKAGSKFSAPGVGHQLLCAVHDTVEKTWRHLDFFQDQTELVARVPRVDIDSAASFTALIRAASLPCSWISGHRGAARARWSRPKSQTG